MTDSGVQLDELSFEELVAGSSVSAGTDPELADVCTAEEANAFAAGHVRRNVPPPHRRVVRGAGDDGTGRRPRRLMTLVACLVVLGGLVAVSSHDLRQVPAVMVAPPATPEVEFLGDLVPESGEWSDVTGPAVLAGVTVAGPAVLDGVAFERALRAPVRACGAPGTVRYAVPPRDAIYRAVVGLADTAPRSLTVKLKVTHRGRTVFSQELETGSSSLFTITALPDDWSTTTLHWTPTGGTCGETSDLVFGDPQL